MFYLTCTMISIVERAYYGVPHAKDCVPVDCGTTTEMNLLSRLNIVPVLHVNALVPCSTKLWTYTEEN